MKIKSDLKERLLSRLFQMVAQAAEANDHPGELEMGLYGMDGTAVMGRFSLKQASGISNRMIVRIYRTPGSDITWVYLTRHTSSRYGPVGERQGYPVTNEKASDIAVTSAMHEIMLYLTGQSHVSAMA